ncbi:MAG: tRNA uridine-5-carboxymethylaminomethyl(34) synthesis enzyme MnmG [Thermoguttaceae bacterium]|jgi:tRNA uridine 5-carboxymethylaminomethyl modification enzyme
MSWSYDVLVVGAGHAGCEAAAAAARAGAKTALLTGNIDTVAQMSCNPAIGGIGKGHFVREIDALGGLMGLAIDATAIQFRMLNVRKGPAMRGPRAQADKRAYQDEVRRLIEEMPNLELRQETVEEILCDGGRLTGLRTASGRVYSAPCVVLACGTFMRGLLHCGNKRMPGGRIGEPSADRISESLLRLGFVLKRFKTGTPPRINARTIDYGKLERQPGDPVAVPFSFMNDSISIDPISCWMTYTNPRLHRFLRDRFGEAPDVNGQLESTGPRYCPSIETKILRFAEKERHQLYLEPESRRTHEVYINGLSTSFSREVQDEMLRMIDGLESAQIIRYAYTIEYDYLPPEQLKLTLETKKVPGLFLCGQLNGTTGYEEAGAQGLVAGTNAALKAAGRDEALVLGRDEAYIGVMLDDLVTRGVDEPYRMFTSRAEYRLLLRHDNADRRLSPIGRKLGLVDDARWNRFLKKERKIEETMATLAATHSEQGSALKFLKRPEVEWPDLAARWPVFKDVPADVAEQITIDAKYAGYIDRQKTEIDRRKKVGSRPIPDDFDYGTVPHLRAEAREKLSRIRPIDLAQAGRVTGITPADIAVLLIALGR